MTAPAFDPLKEFCGRWNIELADRYLPLPDLPHARFECVHGSLVMTPAKSIANTRGEAKLIHLLFDVAEAAGFTVLTSPTLVLNPETWIYPDVTILHTLPTDPKEQKWVPATVCSMVIEFISPSSVYRDLVHKPELCADAGVPYFMWVDLRDPDDVKAALLKLVGGRYETLALATRGQRIEADEPFPISFDPEELLPPAT